MSSVIQCLVTNCCLFNKDWCLLVLTLTLVDCKVSEFYNVIIIVLWCSVKGKARVVGDTKVLLGRGVQGLPWGLFIDPIESACPLRATGFDKYIESQF